VAYLDQLGIKYIDYLFVSHYHFDHIGCIPAALEQFQLQGSAYDRRGHSTGHWDNILLFGTPSAGLRKASFFKFWKPQLKDMADDGEFIKDLRAGWNKQIADQPTFKLYATAGDEDQFVRPESSIFPFLASLRRVVRGDHLSIVKPMAASDPSVQIVNENLVGEAAPSGPGDSARVAVEMREFYDAIKTLQGDPESLDEGGLVQLARALESVGRRDEAIKALQIQRSHSDFTDAMGVLAGRLKRRWLVERKIDDAERASELYQQGFDRSEKSGRHDQAFYHGINVAFMQFAYRNQEGAAQQTAKKVLEHCHAAKADKWRLASEGEANLLLGKIDAAMDSYQAAININPSPRQLDSMFQQAVRVASLVGNEAAADRLQRIFRGDA